MNRYCNRDKRIIKVFRLLFQVGVQIRGLIPACQNRDAGFGVVEFVLSPDIQNLHSGFREGKYGVVELELVSKSGVSKSWGSLWNL